MYNYFKHLYFLSLFNILLMQSLQSEHNNDNKAFYAVSSLCSHVEAVISDDSIDFFSQDDISILWASALESTATNKISLAMDNYYQASITNTPESKKLLIKSKSLLMDSWENLNPYLKQMDVENVVKIENQRSYLLPENSELNAPLRKIFSDPDILLTIKTFTKAGFVIISERPSGMVVASHPKLPGHLVKAYIESKKIKPNWQWAVYRCLGVQYIRELIKEKKLRNFVVPNKWIYPLTPIGDNEDLINNSSRMALIVTDMKLVGRTLSKSAWKTKANKTLIQQLYCILSHGYSSCCLGSNIPYTENGKSHDPYAWRKISNDTNLPRSAPRQ
ncbi:MAG: hypothetical protein H0W50_10245 [Parachlamydiaceae bacterium]|nr:hypothetical protein [Parachlamydiaceae bacterium]